MATFTRTRRLRNSPALRAFARENTLQVADLIYPLFIVVGANVRKEISSMPGQFQLSLDNLDAEIDELIERLVTGIEIERCHAMPLRREPCG